MHICFVTHDYPPAKYRGGAGMALKRLGAEFAANGHDVHVITRAWWTNEETTERDGQVTVHRILPIDITWRGFWKFERFLPATTWKRLKYSIRVSQVLCELKHQGKLDLVISPKWPLDTLWFALFFKRAPLLISLRGSSYHFLKLDGKRLGFDFFIQEALERVLCGQADLIHAVSHHVVETVSTRFPLSRQRVRVIHNPVDLERFQPDPNADGSVQPSVLFVGRVERAKGVELLARAIPLVHADHPEVEFVFVGQDMLDIDGASMRGKLQALLGASAARVRFIDPLSHDALPRYYQQSTVCVLPSLSEGLSNVCLEALACGRPLVATRGTGVEEIVEHGVNGLLVDPDAQGLAGAIRMLLSHPALRQSLGAAGRATVERRFVSTALLPQWLDVLEEVRHSSLNRKKRSNKPQSMSLRSHEKIAIPTERSGHQEARIVVVAVEQGGRASHTT